MGYANMRLGICAQLGFVRLAMWHMDVLSTAHQCTGTKTEPQADNPALYNPNKHNNEILVILSSKALR